MDIGAASTTWCGRSSAAGRAITVEDYGSRGGVGTDAPRPGGREPDGAFEIRIHGRGGQGVVTAAELLSLAAFLEDRRAQAFPSFGSERTGAPGVSFAPTARGA